MNDLTYHCCPWMLEIPSTSKHLTSEEIVSVENGFFHGNLEQEQVGQLFNGMFFLPEGRSRTIQLIYLTRLVDHVSCSPLTEEQEHVFDVSRRTDNVALSCLKGGCIVSCTASALALGAVGPGCFGPSWVMETIALVSSSIGAGVSYLTTGCYPHIASVKANAMQNTFDQAKDLYLELGSHLISLYKDYPDQAKTLAEVLDTTLISRKAASLIGANEAGNLVKPLEKARAFVLNGTIPDSPLGIKNSVELLLLQKKIETL